MYRKILSMGAAKDPSPRSPALTFKLRVIVSIFFISYAGMLFLGQVIHWLQVREWVELPLLYLFLEPPVYVREGVRVLPRWLVGSWTWLESPQSWFGLQRIVYESLAFLHFGILPLAIGVWIAITNLFESE
jgi:hypothetical protein